MRTSRTALWGILISGSFSTVLIYCQCLPFMRMLVARFTTAWVLHWNTYCREEQIKTSALFLSAFFWGTRCMTRLSLRARSSLEVGIDTSWTPTTCSRIKFKTWRLDIIMTAKQTRRLEDELFMFHGMTWAPASAEVSFGVAQCEQSPFPDHAGQDHQGHQHEATGNSEYDWRGSRHPHVWEQESRSPQDLGKEAKQGSAKGKWVRRGETGGRRVKIFPVHLSAIPDLVPMKVLVCIGVPTLKSRVQRRFSHLFSAMREAEVDEINRLLSEEITPTLEKLQKERSNYMRPGCKMQVMGVG